MPHANLLSVRRAFAVAVLVLSPAAHAGFSGSEVRASFVSNFFPGPSLFPNDTAVVGDEVEFELVGEAVDPTYGWLYTVTYRLDFTDTTVRYAQSVVVPGTAGIGGHVYETSYALSFSGLRWDGLDVPLRVDLLLEDKVELQSFDGQRADIFVPGHDWYYGIWGEYYFEQSLMLTLSPVSEPGSAVFAMLGAAALAWRQRRSARAA